MMFTALRPHLAVAFGCGCLVATGCSLTTELDGLTGGTRPADASLGDQGAGGQDAQPEAGQDATDVTTGDAMDATADEPGPEAAADAAGDPEVVDVQDAGTDPESEAPPVSEYAAMVLSDGPAGYWRFDEMSGTTAHDATANGADGTYVGPVAFGVTGAIVGDSDPAILLNGSQPHVTFGDRFDFTGLQPCSLEVWILPSLWDTDYRRILDKETSDANGKQGYFLVLQETGMAFERWRDSAACAVTTGLPSKSVFTHVVATFDGTDMVLYVNGTAVGSSPCPLGMVDHTSPFVAGAASSEAFNYYAGSLDEVAVYDKALDPARVMQHYITGSQ